MVLGGGYMASFTDSTDDCGDDDEGGDSGEDDKDRGGDDDDGNGGGSALPLLTATLFLCGTGLSRRHRQRREGTVGSGHPPRHSFFTPAGPIHVLGPAVFVRGGCEPPNEGAAPVHRRRVGTSRAPPRHLLEFVCFWISARANSNTNCTHMSGVSCRAAEWSRSMPERRVLIADR